MKKIMICILSVLMPMLVSAATGTSTLSIEPFTIKAGETKTMLVDLNNPDQEVTLVQFYINLPAGLSIVKETGNPGIAGRTTAERHTIYTRDNEDVWYIMLASPHGELIYDSTGAIISIKLQAASNFNGGIIKLTRQKIASPDVSYSQPDDYSFTIQDGTPQPETVTIKAKSYTRQYGEDNPTFEYEVTSGSITSGTPTLSCSATKTSPVGTYPIVISQGTVSNSSVTLVNGTLTITKAPLVISAGNYTKVEGEANPTFTPTFSGFKNGETKSVLTKQPTVSTTATTSSPAGTYPVTVSGAEAQNYDFAYIEGTLTVTAKPVVSDIITFADARVKAICVENWDTNGDGELSKDEAAAVKTLGQTFTATDITSFMELQYFTGLTALEDNAFTQCKKLTTLAIPKNVASMGESVFAGCASLTSLTIDEENNYFCMADGMLYTKDMKELKMCLATKSGTVKVNSSCRVIAENAFYNCIGLTAIELPSQLETIKEAVFVGCTSLTTLFIPASVRTIGIGCFSGCSLLESIVVATGNTNFVSIEGVLYNKSKTLLIAYPGNKGKKYDVPDGVTEIASYAFCLADIEEVELPASITKIGSYGISYCGALTKISTYAKKPIVLTGSEFAGLTYSKVTLYVPKGSKPEYEQAEGWKLFPNIVEMESQEEADVVLTVDPVTIKDGSGYVGIGMTNKITVSLMQMYLYLPEGMAPETDSNGKYKYITSGRLTKADVTVAKATNISGNRFLIAIVANGAVSGNEGLLLRIPVAADKTLTGKYEGSIKDILYYDDNYNSDTVSDVTFTITVDGVPGDVNGDGTVDVADIATVISVMANGGVGAADVNGDGTVDVADIATIISIMAGGGGGEEADKTPAGVVAIDLGLPSGTKWANMNIGASSATGAGQYFAWGETATKSTCTWDTYLYGSSPNSVENIGTDIAGTKYDTAKAAWGGGWRMPTNAQWQELIDNCDAMWIAQSGMLLTSKNNGNSLFLPAAGFYESSPLTKGSTGYYWSSVCGSEARYAWAAIINSAKVTMNGSFVLRCYGLPVRPVRK